jgi:hypothetical protein
MRSNSRLTSDSSKPVWLDFLECLEGQSPGKDRNDHHAVSASGYASMDRALCREIDTLKFTSAFDCFSPDAVPAFGVKQISGAPVMPRRLVADVNPCRRSGPDPIRTLARHKKPASLNLPAVGQRQEVTHDRNSAARASSLRCISSPWMRSPEMGGDK